MSEQRCESGTVLTADKNRIHYDHYHYGHGDGVIVIAHGFFNGKDAVLLKDLGRELGRSYDVIIMDFRGHGKSEGLFYWTSKEYMDLEAVLKYARGHYPKVGVVGFSLGAATSLIVAAKTDLMDSLAAVSGPTDFGKIDYRFWELDMENDIFYNAVGEGKLGKGVRPGPFWMKKDSPLALVPQIKAPVLYVHGTNDWVIKPWHSEELHRQTKSRKELVLIQGGPHAEYLMRKNKAEIMRALENWFTMTLKDVPQQ
ncbi:MAG: alpha/beta hydrolase [Candidatus Omnitrophota bacterium]|nr:alpha/beta hydrolase [Candidatus Omnitrophota bacterium]MDZ4242336.1 alpha/beta hydrolase [Candidatus Omnitrophota bacterium]